MRRAAFERSRAFEESAHTFQGLRAALRFIGMARPSRPPGFDMTYRPTESTFGPPFAARIPSLLYMALALAGVAAVVIAEHARAAHCAVGAAAFIEWKGEHIRRLVLVPMLEIQRVNRAVVGQEHAQLRRFELELGQHCVGNAPHFCR